jgi:predicted TIM-barrel enzyme
MPSSLSRSINKDNVGVIVAITGVVVGAPFKVDGDTWSAVDPERLKRFMAIVENLR